jgi:hypothetical protein
MPFACEDAPESENAIQAELDQTILNLDSALSSSNTSELENIIAKTKRLRPTIPSQLQSKNIILATANEKLAQLSFQSITAEANAISAEFQRVIFLSNDIATLRISAGSTTKISSQNDDLTRGNKLELQALKEKFEAQLADATISIEGLQTKISSNKNQAEDLRVKANLLLVKAEKAGLIEGHGSYKSGSKIMRDSQKTDMAAAKLFLESQTLEAPRREEAQAELEAIASKLLGLEHTASLLRQLDDNSIDISANLRQIADELDNNIASLLTENVAKANTLKNKWRETSAQLQDAIKSAGQDRNASKEAKASRSIWKLDMELILGGIEESKLQFLRTESRALNSIITNEIVTSSNKWIELERTIAAEIETASMSANTAYDNAHRLAENVGAKSEMIKSMISNRIAILNGEVVTPVTQTSGGQATSNTSIGGSGFSTPQELISAFNALPPLEHSDGTSPAQNLSIYFDGANAKGKKFLSLLQKISNSSANIAIAVRKNLGEDAIQEMLASVPPSSGGGLISKLNSGTLNVIDDDNATIMDEKGKINQLQKTAGGWKIMLGANANTDPQLAEFAMMMLEGISSISDTQNAMTEKLNAGEITSLEQLKQEMDAAFASIDPF